jgi:heavy metal sensor kinase
MNTNSIRFRLLAWYTGVLMVIFFLLGIAIYLGLKSYLYSDLASRQKIRVTRITENLLANIAQTGDAYVTNQINVWFHPVAESRFFRITREDLTQLYLSGMPADFGFDPKSVPMNPHPPEGVSIRTERVYPDEELIIATTVYQTPQGAKYVVEAGNSTGSALATLRQSMLLLCISLGICLICSTAGGIFLVRKALEPVDQMTASAELISLHNLKERLPHIRTGDELERLANSLNRMIERLQDSLQQNRRFIADASHELRTPLTIMRGELEHMVESSHSRPEWQHSAASVLEEVERLTRIVEGLFAISRLDAGEAQAEWRPFDLASLAGETAGQMSLLAEDKGITITTETASNVMMLGDRSRMKQVIVNVLDNAIKFTGDGGNVHISVERVGGMVELRVADNGVGIPVEAQSRVFDRFFRVDSARSRDNGGAGLGLAIVKSICLAHGGEVCLNSVPGEGTIFTIKLPLVDGRPDPEQGAKKRTVRLETYKQ